MKKHTQNESFLSDEAIVALYWAREEEAIRQTDHKYGKYLSTIAYNILRDRLDCEECLDDTYMGTWNSIPPKRPSVLQSFLAKIMRNMALSRFRKNHAARRIPSELTTSLEELDECMACGKSTQEEYELTETVRILNVYLRTLSDRQMFAFVWRYYYADSVIHIAKMLGVSENTVRRDLGAIRRGLKERLEKEGYRYV